MPTFAQSQELGMATVRHNANLRKGPGLSFAVVGGASQGDSITVVGCNIACDWYELATGNWIAAFLVELETPPLFLGPELATAEPVTIVTWNTQLNDADIDVIAERIATAEDVDLWGLIAVNRLDYQLLLEEAAEVGEGVDFGSVMGHSGGEDRIVALYITARFDMITFWEEDLNNLRSSTPAALLLHLRDKATDVQFLLMVNHLAREQIGERQFQATLLNEWVARQVLPVIAVGDYNFDWNIADDTHDSGYDAIIAEERFQWVQPETLLTTQCSGWPCEFRRVHDFVFTAGAAQQWRAESVIVVRPDDFPDDERRSDHRPVLARVWPELPAATSHGQSFRPTETATPTTPFVTTPGNIRSGPGTHYPIVGQARQGQLIPIIGRTFAGKWYQISQQRWVAAFLIGGVSPRQITVVDPPSTPTPYPILPTASPTPTREVTVTATPE